jgi:putative tricarboxylic transport membrane protein
MRALAVTVASVVFYILVSGPLGFIATTLLVLTALFLTFGVHAKLALPLAAALTMLVHYVFYGLLRVPLPWGILTPWAW